MAAEYVSESTTVTPGGLTSTRSMARSALLADPNDPSTLQSLTEMQTLNGRVSVAAYDAATRTWTRTSAAGRVATTVLDSAGRVVRSEQSLVLPVQMAYDEHGSYPDEFNAMVSDRMTGPGRFRSCNDLAAR